MAKRLNILLEKEISNVWSFGQGLRKWKGSFTPWFFIITGKAHFFQDFEGAAEANDYGTRETSTRPNCGRKSLKIDVSKRYLYLEKKTTINGVVKQKYNPRTHRQVRYWLLLISFNLHSLVNTRALWLGGTPRDGYLWLNQFDISSTQQ